MESEEVLEEMAQQESGETWDCESCPYGRNFPCIGYCLRKILLEMKQKRQDRREGEMCNGEDNRDTAGADSGEPV